MLTRFVITCQLAKLDSEGKPVLNDGLPVYETNYFCQFVTHPTQKNVTLIEWDTDNFYAMNFPSKTEAKKTVKRIETGEPLEIKEINL
jgi:hypothetical protein